MRAPQAGDLQQRLAGARKHPKQIAFLRARLLHDVGPFSTASPQHCRTRRREVELRCRFDTVFPFFTRNFETDVFEPTPELNFSDWKSTRLNSSHIPLSR